MSALRSATHELEPSEIEARILEGIPAHQLWTAQEAIVLRPGDVARPIVIIEHDAGEVFNVSVQLARRIAGTLLADAKLSAPVREAALALTTAATLAEAEADDAFPF